MQQYTESNISHANVIKSIIVDHKYDDDVSLSLEQLWHQRVTTIADTYCENDERRHQDIYNMLINMDATLPTPTLKNSAPDTIMSNAPCYLVSLVDDCDSLNDVVDIAIKATENNGSTGINFMNVSTTLAVSVAMTLESNINRVNSNMNNKRPGSANIVTELHSAHTWKLLKDYVNTEQHLALISTTLTIKVPMLFILRLQQKDATWTFFEADPRVDDLYYTYGKDYDDLYKKLAADDSIKKIEVPLLDVINTISEYKAISKSPMLMCRDAMYYRSPQRPLASKYRLPVCVNLCNEFIQVTSQDMGSVCSLGSVSLRSIVKEDTVDKYPYGYADSIQSMDDAIKYVQDVVDFDKLIKTVGILTRVVSQVGRNSKYVHEICDHGYNLLRPIGIGRIGYYDAMNRMRASINIGGKLSLVGHIFNVMTASCIYYNTIVESIRMAIDYGPAPLFDDTTYAEGKFVFDLQHEYAQEMIKCGHTIPMIDNRRIIEPYMWGQHTVSVSNVDYQSCYDSLRALIHKYGMYNTCVTSQPPGSTSSSLAMCTESIEIAPTLYSERIRYMATLINMPVYLCSEFAKIGVDAETLIDYIRNHNYTVHGIGDYIGTDEARVLESVYKTNWEMPYSVQMQLYKGAFNYIDQSQSVNYFPSRLTHTEFNSMLLFNAYGGFPTLLYYIRERQEWTETDLRKSGNRSIKLFPTNDDVCEGCGI